MTITFIITTCVVKIANTFSFVPHSLVSTHYIFHGSIPNMCKLLLSSTDLYIRLQTMGMKSNSLEYINAYPLSHSLLTLNIPVFHCLKIIGRDTNKKRLFSLYVGSVQIYFMSSIKNIVTKFVTRFEK